MLTLFFWITIVFAGAEWAAVEMGWRRVRWFTKPGTLIAMLIWFTEVGGWTGPLMAFGLGLVFSLLGDVLLLLPRRFFLSGMIAYGITHLFYIAGFNQLPLALRWEMAVPVLAVTGAFTLLNRRVRMGVKRQTEQGLIVPVVAYAILLTLMWLAALTTLLRPGWLMLSSVMVSFGGGLFFLSDSILAFNRFVKQRPYGELAVMFTYHLAQIMIIGGVLEQFLLI